MKLAFSTNAFRSMSIEDTIKVLGDIGYDGIELMADTPHIWPMSMTDAQVDSIRSAMDAANLEFSNINAFMMVEIDSFHHPSWIEASAERRGLRIEHTNQSLHLAKSLGIPFITTEPGGPLDGQTYEQGMNLFRETLSESLAVAEETGVRLLVEPEPELLIETSDQMQELLDTLPHEMLGVNFDIGHFYCVGEDPADLIRRYPHWIEHIHLEDIPESREHIHMMPGEGAIDFADIFQALAEIHYDGWVTLELYPYENDPVKTAERAYEVVQPWVESHGS